MQEKKVEVVDPELKAKQAAEEEKRVKRAARFGPAVVAEVVSLSFRPPVLCCSLLSGRPRRDGSLTNFPCCLPQPAEKKQKTDA